MLPATAMRSRALCALMLAAAVLGGVDAAKKSQQEEKWHSVRAYSGKPGEQFEIRGEEGIGERVLVSLPASSVKPSGRVASSLGMLSTHGVGLPREDGKRI